MMEIESFFNIKMAYVLVFYMATNIIPANVEEFKIDTQNLKNQSESLTLNITKQKDNWWRADAKQHPDEFLYFSFSS